MLSFLILKNDFGVRLLHHSVPVRKRESMVAIFNKGNLIQGIGIHSCLKGEGAKKEEPRQPGMNKTREQLLPLELRELKGRGHREEFENGEVRPEGL